MIVLSRKKNEAIVIGDDITVVVVEIRGDKVRLGIEYPKEVPVHRKEVFDAIHRHELAQGHDRVSTSPASGPAEVTLSGRHVELVDRLRNTIREKTGTAPSRAETIAAILDMVGESEQSLGQAESLIELKSLLAKITPGHTR